VFSLNSIIKYVISSIEEPVKDTKVYKIKPKHGKVFKFSPGQFAFLHILDAVDQTIVKKPYSIASAPEEEYLEFCIKLVDGELTSKLAKLKKGEIVGIEGPFGHFTYGDETESAFVAGGTGIAPFISVFRHVTKKKINGKFVLFYSARTLDQILYRKELQKLEEMNPNITIVITLTREKLKDWDGEYGRITGDMLYKYTKNTTDFHWWICGPMEMIKNIKQNLLVQGVDPEKIKMEGWG